jgi:ABC-2 type transport system permease protein
MSASTQTVVLSGRSLRDRWRSLLAWGLGLVGIGVIQLAVYPSVSRSSTALQDFIDQYPEALKEAFGMEDYGSGPGFLSTEMFSMVVPLVLIAVAVGYAAAATAGEEERGTLDLLLALPVRRWDVVLAKTAAMVLGVAIVGSLLFLTILVMAPVVDLEVATSGLAAATLMSALMGLLFGGVALLLGALTGHRAAALGGSVGLALAAFLLQVLAPMADWLEPWQPASPFEWAVGSKPLTQGLHLGYTGLFVGLFVLLVALAAVVFERRDISTR